MLQEIERRPAGEHLFQIDRNRRMENCLFRHYQNRSPPRFDTVENMTALSVMCYL
jgi:hypothetical protein